MDRPTQRISGTASQDQGAVSYIAFNHSVGIGIVVALSHILAAVLLRSYNLGESPPWVDRFHQYEMPFILIEICVIFWAHQQGLRFSTVIANLKKLDRNCLFLFLGTFWVSSVFVSPVPVFSGLRAAYWLIHLAFGVSVFFLSRGATVREFKVVGAWQFLSLALFVPIMVVHLALAPNIPFDGTHGVFWQASIPGLLSIRHLGIWAAGILSLAIGCLWADQKIKRYELVYAAIAVATGLLCWSGTRSGVFGVGVAALTLLGTTRRLPPLRIVLPAVGACFAGALVSAALWLPPDGAFGLFHILSRLQPGVEDPTSGRMYIWLVMLGDFTKQPIFGGGEGVTRWTAAFGGVYHIQPHNFIVQFLTSWGLVASSAAALMLIRIRIAMHEVARTCLISIPSVALFDAMIAMSLVDGGLYFSRMIIMTIGAAAITLAIGAKNKQQVDI
jgi:exopolysaccharide production protein ExoQ